MIVSEEIAVEEEIVKMASMITFVNVTRLRDIRDSQEKTAKLVMPSRTRPTPISRVRDLQIDLEWLRMT